ncbi:LysR substrate-binding domain-containing protein [Rhizobium lentis]|uniref:LysR substrate-binding domain-containing protein n=1 Tax=Rhizobium lentis TaxID=1138194 RepID=UPI002180CDA8|nr:LysR substrate-binding domain-containing protein [Rhizobium lentis]
MSWQNSTDRIKFLRYTKCLRNGTMMAAMETAVSGLGITFLPISVCETALATGRLVRLLPEWTAGGIETTILMPHRRGQLPAVRAVVDFLAERLAEG